MEEGDHLHEPPDQTIPTVVEAGRDGQINIAVLKLTQAGLNHA